MSKSLRVKLIFIMVILILLLMVVVCIFLIRGVQRFYTDQFYDQMQNVFSDVQMVSSMRSAAGSDDPVNRLNEIMTAYAGVLGIDTGTRNYYILSGDTGEYLAGSDSSDGRGLIITPNIMTALSGSEGYDSDITGDYMDVAFPITGGGNTFVICIHDNKQTIQNLNGRLIEIILQAVAIGIVISTGVSILLSSTMLRPIQGMTRAAEKMAVGDFSNKIDVQSDDEIGTLSETFNNMAARLEANIEETRKSEEMRREFVANVSHELRTPITGIRSYAETLTENDDMPPEMKNEFLHVIVNESDRMTKIVQDLLELSRFDAGRTSFNFEKISMEQSVRDVYAALAMEASKRHQTVNLELEWKLPEVRCDKARIEQVLMNVVSNAVKYTPDGGTIDISSGHRDDMVWIEVEDTGIGIPEEDVPRVFDRFYRVDKARSRESGGTGLGLSIAHEIISRHGGRIEITSKLGAGTTVRVLLPIEGPSNA